METGADYTVPQLQLKNSHLKILRLVITLTLMRLGFLGKEPFVRGCAP